MNYSRHCRAFCPGLPASPAAQRARSAPAPCLAGFSWPKNNSAQQNFIPTFGRALRALLSYVNKKQPHNGEKMETLKYQPKLVNAKEDRHFVTALARGLDLLSCFRAGENMLGNQDLAERSRLPKSTVSRLTYYRA
jgi:hypothetical protein